MSSRQTMTPPEGGAPAQSPKARPPQDDSATFEQKRAARTRFWLTALFWAIITLGLSALYYKHYFPGNLTDPDAMDFAQIARNVAAGHGFATSVIRPLAVDLLSKIGALPLSQGHLSGGTTPDISHAPLYPVLLAIPFALQSGHTSEALAKVDVLVSLVFFWLSVFALYRLARTLFPAPQQQMIAWLSVAAYLLGGEALHYAVTALPVSLTTLLVTMLLIALYRAHETTGRPASPLQELGIGVLLGFCFLAQYSLILLLIPALVYVYASRAPQRAWRGVGLCALGFVLISGLWLIRNAHLSQGNPFYNLLFYNLLTNSPEYPGATSIYRSAAPSFSLFSYFVSNPAGMLGRFGSGLLQDQARLLETFNLFVLAAALATLFWRSPDARLNAIRGYTVVCILLITAATALFMPSVAVLAPFLPIITVVAAGFIWNTLQQQQWPPLYQQMAIGIWILCIAFGVFSRLLDQKPNSLMPIGEGVALLTSPPLPAKAAQSVKTGAVITDLPWEITWMTGQPAVWIPNDNAAYEITNQRLPAPALLLTPGLAGYQGATGEARVWMLLSTHPDYYAQYQNDLKNLSLQPANLSRLKSAMEGRAKSLSALIAAGDPRVKMTQAQLHQQAAAAEAALPHTLQARQAQLEQGFTDNFGSISEVLADYVSVAQKPESNQLNSTLFVQRTLLPKP